MVYLSCVTLERCWTMLRKAHKGQLPRIKPRKSCIRFLGPKRISAGHPCILCQLKISEEYTLRYNDVALMRDFLCPHTHQVLDPYVTGLCAKQDIHVQRMVRKAHDFGIIFIFYNFWLNLSPLLSLRRFSFP
ncbi:hypothetical protein MXB_1887 [Myxobolus squamalis]|nr:hypothetical protein MXB_1887 [Myxobolus squamalis]